MKKDLSFLKDSREETPHRSTLEPTHLQFSTPAMQTPQNKLNLNTRYVFMLFWVSFFGSVEFSSKSLLSLCLLLKCVLGELQETSKKLEKAERDILDLQKQLQEKFSHAKDLEDKLARALKDGQNWEKKFKFCSDLLKTKEQRLASEKTLWESARREADDLRKKLNDSRFGHETSAISAISYDHGNEFEEC